MEEAQGADPEVSLKSRGYHLITVITRVLTSQRALLKLTGPGTTFRALA